MSEIEGRWVSWICLLTMTNHLVLPSGALSAVRRPASQGLSSTVGEVEERGGKRIWGAIGGREVLRRGLMCAEAQRH
jgi:hypothetical protein